MGFDIAFVESTRTDPVLIRFGRIRIGDFEERFETDTSFWSTVDYERQWLFAVQRIIEGMPSSALITSMTDPSTANFLFWWPMYRVGSRVIIQNQVLFLEELDFPFNPSDPYSQIRARESITEDGVPISEWSIGVNALSDFVGVSYSKTRSGE